MQNAYVDHTYLSSVRRFFVAVPSARKHLLVAWRQWPAIRIGSACVLSQLPAAWTGPLSGTLGPACWIQRGPVRVGTFGRFSPGASSPLVFGSLRRGVTSSLSSGAGARRSELSPES